MIDLIIFIITLSVTYFIGTTVIEKKHYRSIIERERKFLQLPAVTTQDILDREIQSACMVCGSVVISIDYFKKFLAGLKNIFGGELSSFETVLDRSRREAILRMKETAKGAQIIINTRIETSTIGKSDQRKSVGCSEVLAYGTAIIYK
ncbi:MAG: YbjQ family protein [Omnitrophica bacterium]|nr:YbjQ family protein [Candidatus Omnitrophota bacterium]